MSLYALIMRYTEFSLPSVHCVTLHILQSSGYIQTAKTFQLWLPKQVVVLESQIYTTTILRTMFF
jgi:hypothetical protein